MTPEAEQSILNFVGILLGSGFTALLYLANRVRANRTARIEVLAAEGDGDYYYHATAGAGVKAGALAKGRE